MRSFWITAISMLAVLIITSSNVFTNIAQAPTGYTGAPSEATCATSGCHSSNVPLFNSGAITLASQPSTALASGATANTDYNLFVNAGNAARYGFSLTAIDGNGNPAGTFTATNTNNTVAQTGVTNRSYISHKNANTTSAWAFRWTAPATIPAEIYFYLAVNQANNDGSNGGDQIHLKAYKLTSSGLAAHTTPIGIQPINADDAAEVDIFPNPVVDNLHLSFSVADNANTTAEVYSISGQMVKTLFNEDLSAGSFDRSYRLGGELTEGLYLVKLQMNEQVYFKKIMVQ